MSADGRTDWYCTNQECLGMVFPVQGERPGPCPACGAEMEPDDAPPDPVEE